MFKEMNRNASEQMGPEELTAPTLTLLKMIEEKGPVWLVCKIGQGKLGACSERDHRSMLRGLARQVRLLR